MLAERYQDEPFVEVVPFTNGESIDEWSLDPTALNDTNRIRLHVFPNPAGHLLLVGLLDNLREGGFRCRNTITQLDVGTQRGNWTATLTSISITIAALTYLPNLSPRIGW